MLKNLRRTDVVALPSMPLFLAAFGIAASMSTTATWGALGLGLLGICVAWMFVKILSLSKNVENSEPAILTKQQALWCALAGPLAIIAGYYIFSASISLIAIVPIASMFWGVFISRQRDGSSALKASYACAFIAVLVLIVESAGALESFNLLVQGSVVSLVAIAVVVVFFVLVRKIFVDHR